MEENDEDAEENGHVAEDDAPEAEAEQEDDGVKSDDVEAEAIEAAE